MRFTRFAVMVGALTMAVGSRNASAGASDRSEATSANVVSRAVDEAMPLGSVPALGVLEVRHGVITGLRVTGVRRIGSTDRVQPEDTWHLGSNAKPMTAVLVQMLVEHGKLRWSDRVLDRLPELTAANAKYRDVTLLDLATHTSGLPENSDTDVLLSFYNDRRSLPRQRVDYLKRAFADPPSRARGQYGYSNTGFIALGAVAERTTGRSYEQLMKRMIFQPLGLRSAGFGPTGPNQPAYHENGQAVSGPKGDNPLMFAPAGGIHMSLEDWARWSIDQMHGEDGRGRLLAAAGYQFLHQPKIDRPGRDTRIAVDWGVTERPFGPLLFHSGSNGGWFALIALAPEIGNAALVVANGAEDMKGDVVTNKALRVLLDSWEAESFTH